MTSTFGKLNSSVSMGGNSKAKSKEGKSLALAGVSAPLGVAGWVRAKSSGELRLDEDLVSGVESRNKFGVEWERCTCAAGAAVVEAGLFISWPNNEDCVAAGSSAGSFCVVLRKADAP